ncbi:MAG: ArsR family transcriptional regulator [Candidatus Bathyarchaeia archaeon]|jgi:DNA-binding transcriptional ArsR family regulator
MSEKKEKMKRRTDATIDAFKSQRLRWVMGRSQIKVEVEEDKYKKAVDSIMHDEVERSLIKCALKEKGPLTVEEISQLTGLQPSVIVQHIIALRKNGVIAEAGEKNRQYLYTCIA